MLVKLASCVAGLTGTLKHSILFFTIWKPISPKTISRNDGKVPQLSLTCQVKNKMLLEQNLYCPLSEDDFVTVLKFQRNFKTVTKSSSDNGQF